MSKMPIICFIGLDGSGKSTSIEYAYKVLKERGYNVEVVRAAYVVKFMTFLVKIGKKIVMKRNSDPYSSDYRVYLQKLRNQKRKGFVYKVFSFLTTIEFKIQIWWHIKSKNRMGRLLLVDRYIYDNVVTYAANLGLGEKYMKETLDSKWKNAPLPDLIVYIKTPVEVCCSRKDDIPDPLYLEIRKPLYNRIATMCNAVVISGDQDINAMYSNVIEEIEPYLI